MFVSTLKQWERVLTQLFIPGSLLRALRSKSLSSEVYLSRPEPWRDVTTLAFTKAAPLKVTRLWKR